MDPIVIVLAAGRGERFRASGGHTDKLNSLLAGRRVRDHVLEAVRASGLPWHVVERADTAHLASLASYARERSSPRRTRSRALRACPPTGR